MARYLIPFLTFLTLAIGALFYPWPGPKPATPPGSGEPGPAAIWTMLDVNAKGLQGDAHLLRMEGTTVLIDTGEARQDLLAGLERYDVKRIDALILTHAHRDHYGGLTELLDGGISIQKIYFNEPGASCERERPWGCDRREFQKPINKARAMGVPVFPIRTGAVLAHTPRATLEVLAVYDGEKTPVGPTDVNDMTPLMRLTVGKIRALFTGDLNSLLGEYFAKSDLDLSAALLKVPHHGAEATVPDSFLQRVSPRLALVPTPRVLWESPRCARIRKFLADRKIPAWVNGLHGDVTVEMSENDFSLESDRPDETR
jgi:beta-lactamase superfamily II metal-dependent hydrolase